MPLNLDAIGKDVEPFHFKYTWKEVVLYALGVGAGFDELEYCYEKNLQAVPSFAIVPGYALFWEVINASGVNLAGVLQGEQEIIFEHPIPVEGQLTIEGRIKNIYDKGADKGALIIAQGDAFDDQHRKLFSSIFKIFARLDGGFGGANAPAEPLIYPERSPDHTISHHPAANQPLLYRLSGDLFELHADPDFAAAVGFERPIMHGLCTFGYACRALIQSMCPGQPHRVRRLSGRFTKPLYPGQPIRTFVWQVAPDKALWRTINSASGEVVIDRGEFELHSH